MNLLGCYFGFSTDDDKKKTQVFAGASSEYLSDEYKCKFNNPTPANLNELKNKIIKKWQEVGNNIFDRKIYYDSYATSNEGDANLINFLTKKSNDFNG